VLPLVLSRSRTTSPIRGVVLLLLLLMESSRTNSIMNPLLDTAASTAAHR
jgi:hypothetical protein